MNRILVTFYTNLISSQCNDYIMKCFGFCEINKFMTTFSVFEMVKSMYKLPFSLSFYLRRKNFAYSITLVIISWCCCCDFFFSSPFCWDLYILTNDAFICLILRHMKKKPKRNKWILLILHYLMFLNCLKHRTLSCPYIQPLLLMLALSLNCLVFFARDSIFIGLIKIDDQQRMIYNNNNSGKYINE